MVFRVAATLSKKKKNGCKYSAMGIKIFRRENWDRWESGPYTLMDFLLDPEKDRWLLQHMLSHCSDTPRSRIPKRFNLDQVPGPPVNVDDPGDEMYAPYIMLREQVMREDDWWALKAAALEAPNAMMRRFAFCRLTGYSWPGDECDAYSYRTWDCGLKSVVPREDIEDFCREMIASKGQFAVEAAEWLEKLPTFSDDVLAEWSAGKTERKYDSEPEEVLRKRLRPARNCTAQEDLEDKLLAIFDAYIFRKYQRHHFNGSGIVLKEAAQDSLTYYLAGRFEKARPHASFEVALEEVKRSSGWDPGLTPEQIDRLVWSVSPRSRQHSYFLWMAYWFGIDVDEDDDKAIKLLTDAAERGHLRAYDELVRIYATVNSVHRNIREALRWQEKKVGVYRKAYEADGQRDSRYSETRRPYARVLRETGDFLKDAGYDKRARQYYHQAEQLEEREP